MPEPTSHPVLTHTDGSQCIWLDDYGWFVPFDISGGGESCKQEHPFGSADPAAVLAVSTLVALKELADQIAEFKWTAPTRNRSHSMFARGFELAMQEAGIKMKTTSSAPDS